MEIDYLANHRDCIPQLAQWGYGEWRSIFDHYGMSLEDVIGTFERRAQRESLPLGLVALDGARVVGTGSLKLQDLELRPALTPWLGGIFVDKEYRGRGVGTAIIQRLLVEAQRLRLPRVYLWTTSAQALYLKLGWTEMEELTFCGATISVMEKRLLGP